MTARLLDGKALSQKLKESMKDRIHSQLSSHACAPGLAVVIVGDNSASHIYVKNKELACEAVGMNSWLKKLPESTSQAQLLALVETLNNDPAVHGILVQMPLPDHINSSMILQSIRPDKDVDGFHPMNVGKLALREPGLRPCTPKGIMRLLSHSDIETKGVEAVVVGASNIVGRPMALELLQSGSTVTVCHRFTKALKSHVERADLLVVAAGKPGLIPGDLIKPGAVVVDVGISRLDNGRICGDVDFDTAQERASWITPVPGGVGPMTVAMLLENTMIAAGFEP